LLDAKIQQSECKKTINAPALNPAARVAAWIVRRLQMGSCTYLSNLLPVKPKPQMQPGLWLTHARAVGNR
jgi:hypothetical protein